MPNEGSDFLHGGIFPYYYLIQRVSVRAHDFVDSLREHHITYLTASVDKVNRLERVGVPKSNAPVGSAAASGQKAMLMGTPSDGLDCGRVLGELGHRLLRVWAPNHQLVVISPGR